MTGEVRVQPVDTQQPWVGRLSGAERQDYDDVRQESIDEQKAAVARKLAELLAKAEELGVEAVIDKAALAIATDLRNTFEAGIQVGMDSVRAHYEASSAYDAAFQRNVVGN